MIVAAVQLMSIGGQRLDCYKTEVFLGTWIFPKIGVPQMDGL